MLFDLAGIVGCDVRLCKTTEEGIEKIEESQEELQSCTEKEDKDCPKEVLEGLFKERKKRNLETRVNFLSWREAFCCRQLEFQCRRHMCSFFVGGCALEARKTMFSAALDKAKNHFEKCENEKGKIRKLPR